MTMPAKGAARCIAYKHEALATYDASRRPTDPQFPCHMLRTGSFHTKSRRLLWHSKLRALNPQVCNGKRDKDRRQKSARTAGAISFNSLRVCGRKSKKQVRARAFAEYGSPILKYLRTGMHLDLCLHVLITSLGIQSCCHPDSEIGTGVVLASEKRELKLRIRSL